MQSIIVAIALVAAALVGAVCEVYYLAELQPKYLATEHHITRLVYGTVPDSVWQDALANGAYSDPTDHCECLYVKH